MHTFDYERVLIILPERLGDSLFHTPAIRLLKSERPNISLGIIALSQLSAELLQNNPFVDAVYVAPTTDQARQLGRNYDVTLLLHNHDAAISCAKAIGLPTISIEKQVAGSRHRSQNSYDFICKLLHVTTPKVDNRYNLYPTAHNSSYVKNLLISSGANDTDILIGCHIGCHSIAKRGWKFWRPLAHPKVWPFENFLSLEKALREISPRFRLVLTGSKSEKALGEKFARNAPSTINLIDRTSVLDLAALMQQLQLFISSDTGALHVACATNVGLIGLFGPTKLAVTGPHPLQSNHTVLQSTQLANITVTQVVDAVTQHTIFAAPHSEK